MNFKTIILAAGMGTRMKSKYPKVIHKVCNKTMLEHVILSTKKAGCLDIGVVVGYQGDVVKKCIKTAFEGDNINVDFFEQNKQLGTGHAVLQAVDFIDDDKDILVLCGDTPLVKSETIKTFIKFHNENKNDVTVISAIAKNPAGYGRIVRKDDESFLKIVEQKDTNETENLIDEINTGVYIFKGSLLKLALSKLKNENNQGEYYLTDTLEILLSENKKVGVFVSSDETEFIGVNSRKQLYEVSNAMKLMINEMHLENGVTIVDINNTYIDFDVIIGADTIIHPGTVLEGKTSIGDDCVIGPNVKLLNVEVANNTKIEFSVLLDSKVGSNNAIGPFAYVRPNCEIGDDIKIGDFVEVKNSVIGNGTKVSHLTYIGDSDVGENINFGCGTITVNYDGTNKFRTTVKDNAFIGCNTNLVAPVVIEENSYVAAGSTITKDVPENALGIARQRQQNLLGWKKS